MVRLIKDMIKKKKKRYSFDNAIARRIVIVVIVLLIIIVGIALACRLWLNPERLAMNKLEEMAREYYENYTYESLARNAESDEELAELMKRYVERGFAPVNLRQLLLYDDQKNMKDGGFLREMCDENTTSVKFYPEEPFDRYSYRIEYKLDCDFDK